MAASRWWTVNGRKMRELREGAEQTMAELAEKTGVSERTVVKIEHGGVRVQRSTLEAMAKHFKVPLDILGARAWDRAATPDLPIGEDKLPPRSRLEGMVRKTARASDPREPGPDGRLTLSPRVIQDIYTAYALRDGVTYVLHARIDRQRGVGFGDARILGCPFGVAARFMAVQPVAPDQPFSVTVYSTERALTLALQAEVGSERELTLHLRLAQVLYAESGATVSGITPTTEFIPEHAREPFKGFASFESNGFRPWVLIVEAVAPRAPSPPPTPPPADRAAGRRSR